jgi:hypothetical protein
MPHATQSAGDNTFKRRHRLVLIRLKTEGKLKDITGLSLYSWKDTGMTMMARYLTPFQLRDHARHSSTDISMRYYNAEQIIPEVRESKMGVIDDLIKKQKERIFSK